MARLLQFYSKKEKVATLNFDRQPTITPIASRIATRYHRDMFLFRLMLLTVAVFGAIGPARAQLHHPFLNESSLALSQASDLKTFATTLADRHKNPWANVKADVFADACAEVFSQADNLDQTAFYFALCRLAALMGDSHTTVTASTAVASSMRYLAIQLTPIGGRHVVTAIASPYADLVGGCVTAINGTPIEEASRVLASYVSADNEVWRMQQCARLMRNASALGHCRIIDQVGSCLFTITTDGQEIEVTIPLAEPGMEYSYLQTNRPPTSPGTEFYRIVDMGTSAVVFIQYNQCSEDNAYPLDDFNADIEQAIMAKHPQKVIVDLRYNGGGDSRLFEPTVKLLGRLQKSYGFQLFALIGSSTFSSAILNALHLKARTDCTLAGTPSGGSASHYGEVKRFTLPASLHQVGYSTKYFHADGAPDGSLMPDVEIELDTEDIRNGIDTVVETIVRL
mgnify:CR=1 FL=1